MHYGRASQPPAHPSVDPNSVACRRRAPFFLHRVYRSSSPGFYLSLSLFSDARARERLALAQSLSRFSLFLPLRYSRPSFFFFLSLRRSLLVIPVRPLALLLLPPRCTPGRVERSLNSIGLLGGRSRAVGPVAAGLPLLPSSVPLAGMALSAHLYRAARPELRPLL